MSRLTLLLLVIVACGAPSPSTPGKYLDPCVGNFDCAAPTYCRDGVCCVDEDLICSPASLRCHGDDLEKCVETAPENACGDAPIEWQVESQCADGCEDASCRP